MPDTLCSLLALRCSSLKKNPSYSGAIFYNNLPDDLKMLRTRKEHEDIPDKLAPGNIFLQPSRVPQLKNPNKKIGQELKRLFCNFCNKIDAKVYSMCM